MSWQTGALITVWALCAVGAATPSTDSPKAHPHQTTEAVIKTVVPRPSYSIGRDIRIKYQVVNLSRRKDLRTFSLRVSYSNAEYIAPDGERAPVRTTDKFLKNVGDGAGFDGSSPWEESLTESFFLDRPGRYQFHPYLVMWATRNDTPLEVWTVEGSTFTVNVKAPNFKASDEQTPRIRK